LSHGSLSLGIRSSLIHLSLLLTIEMLSGLCSIGHLPSPGYISLSPINFLLGVSISLATSTT